MYAKNVDRIYAKVKDALAEAATIPTDHKTHELLDCEDNLRAAKQAIEAHWRLPT